MKEVKHWTEKEKYKQCDKEAIITLIVFTAYAVWWYFTGFGLWESGNDTWICGLPLWFVLSSIVGWILCIIAVWFVVKVFFKDFDLGEEADIKSAEAKDVKEE